MYAIPDYSFGDPAVLAFILIPIALALLLAYSAAAASARTGASSESAASTAVLTLVVSAIWMAVTWIAAQSGILLQWDRRPPPFAILLLATFGLAAAISVSPFGRRLAVGLPLGALVAVQSFRLPLELAMHRLSVRGIMPAHMSYSGWNFDIVTGISAIVVAIMLRTKRGGHGLVAAWNALGFLLLANVLVIAVLSTPAVQLFGPDRVVAFVMYPPFVWLPAVMVLAALAGHTLVFLALRERRRSHSRTSSPAAGAAKIER